MGIQIVRTVLNCDHKGCSYHAAIEEPTVDHIKKAGWLVYTARAPYVEEWRVYCPNHKEKQNGQMR